MRDLIGFLPVGGQYKPIKFKIRTLNSLVNTHWSQEEDQVLVFYKFQDGVYPWVYTKSALDLLTQRPYSSLEKAVWKQVPGPGADIMPDHRQMTFIKLPGFSGLRPVDFEGLGYESLTGLHLKREQTPENLSLSGQTDGRWMAVLYSDADPRTKIIQEIGAIYDTVWKRVAKVKKKPKRSNNPIRG